MTTREPSRPLGPAGHALWDRAWQDNIWTEAETELLLIAAEQVDERAALRVRVIRDNVDTERKALRELDRQIVANLTQLGFFRQRDVYPPPQIVNDPEVW